MKKRGLLMTVIFLLTTAMLAACSDGSDKAGTNGDKEVITYALWDKEQAPVYREIADAFEKENKNIEVKFELTPWAQYFTKLETSITGNNAPDVFWVNLPRVPDYIDNGVLMEVDDVEFDKDKIPEQHLKAYTKKGKLYGIPKDFDSHALYYNRLC